MTPAHSGLISEWPELQFWGCLLTPKDHFLHDTIASEKDVKIIPFHIGTGEEQERSGLQRIIVVMKNFSVIHFDNPFWGTQLEGDFLSGRDADFDLLQIIGVEGISVVALYKGTRRQPEHYTGKQDHRHWSYWRRPCHSFTRQ